MNTCPECKRYLGSAGHAQGCSHSGLSPVAPDHLLAAGDITEKLDGATVGRLGISKAQVGDEPWLTVYNREEENQGFGDEQLTLRPEELLELCRFVVESANNDLSGTR